ncbi:MAG: hypothetical protein ACE5GI_01040 [Candidatus Aminicenantales bacterium]
MIVKFTGFNIENPSDFKYCQEYVIPFLHPEEVSYKETLEASKEELTGKGTFANKIDTRSSKSW